MAPYSKRPSGPAFNPNRLIIDLPTLETARLAEAAKQHRKSPSVLAALVLSDWIKRNTPEMALNGKPVPDDEPSRTDELAAKFSSQPAAPEAKPDAAVMADLPETSAAIAAIENRPRRPRPFGLI